MTQIPVTHVTVQDAPMPNQTEVIGHYWVPEFKTIIPEYSPNYVPDFIGEDGDDEDESFIDEVEAKIIKPRGRRPKAPTEGVETK